MELRSSTADELLAPRTNLILVYPAETYGGESSYLSPRARAAAEGMVVDRRPPESTLMHQPSLLE